jgi:hypothetical protein
MGQVDRETFERELEEAMALLEHPPRPGSAEDRRFVELLARLESYREPDTPPETEAPDSGASELGRRIEALRRRREGVRHPDGLGPTLGMDLDRSGR